MAWKSFVIFSLLFVCNSTVSLDITEVEVETIASGITSWDETTLPPYPGGQPEITLLKYTIPPHTTVDWHKHNVINVGYILSGSIKVIADDGKTINLKAGDSLVELVGKWHYGINEGDSPVEILVFYAGTEGTVNTEKRPPNEK